MRQLPTWWPRGLYRGAAGGTVFTFGALSLKAAHRAKIVQRMEGNNVIFTNVTAEDAVVALCNTEDVRRCRECGQLMPAQTEDR